MAILKKVVGETLVMSPRFADLDDSGDYGPQWKFKDWDNNLLYVSAKYGNLLQKAGVLDENMEFIPGSGFSYTSQDKARPVIKPLGAAKPMSKTIGSSGSTPVAHARPVVTWQVLEDRLKAAFIATQRAIPEDEELSEEARIKLVISLYISAGEAGLAGIPVAPIKSLAEELLGEEDEPPF